MVQGRVPYTAAELTFIHSPRPRTGTCCSAGMTPSGPGPIPMSRLPFFEMMSQKLRTSSVEVTMSSGRSLRFAPKEWPTPRVDSHFLSRIVSDFAYSGVVKSKCFAPGKVSVFLSAGMNFQMAWARSPAAPVRVSVTTFRLVEDSIQRSLMTPSSTVL